MYFCDLQKFLKHLDNVDNLIRVQEVVDPYLEISSIVNNCCKDATANRALLFENIKGSKLPLVANIFGSSFRTDTALGVSNIAELTDKLRGGLARYSNKSSGNALQKLISGEKIVSDRLGKDSWGSHLKCEKKLYELPVLHSWPNDGGRYITLGQVFTRHPDSAEQNCGMYRLQVVGENKALIRLHPGTGCRAHMEEWHARGQAMPITIILGGPPVVTWSAGLSLPSGVTEIDFVDYLTGHPTSMAACNNSDIHVPLTAEVVIEGQIGPEDLQDEGPFANHTGYYSSVTAAPVVNVHNMYMRDTAVYPCTVVGPPPMENIYLAQASKELLLVLLQHDCPWVVDVHMPLEGIYHKAALVAVDAQEVSSEEVLEVLNQSLLLKNARLIILLDKNCDLRSFGDSYWRIINADSWEDSVVINGQTMSIDARTSKVRIPLFE